MIKILDDFTHERGMHCDTTALRDVFAYAGHELPEAALFGLGGGLSFFCWKGGQYKYPRAGGRIKPLELDRRLCSNLGVGLSIHTSTSTVRAHDAMRKMLAQDKPVMMHTDVFYLKYAKAVYHFGAHNVVVAGMDESEGVAYVADYMADGLFKVPASQLMEARSSTNKPFPPKNRWFEFDFPKDIMVDEQLIMRVISRNALEMLNAYIRNLGIGGIYYFSTTLRSLASLYSDKEVEAICDDTYFSIESSDTGGGCFRRMYADFLLWAYEETGIERLKQVSDGYRQAAMMWSLAARMLKDVKCGCVSLDEAADMVNMIAAKEQELMTDLLCVSNLCCKKK